MKPVAKLSVSLAAVVLALLVLAGCASGPNIVADPGHAVTGKSASQAPTPGAQGGLTEGKWRVTAIDHGGKTTQVPARYNAYLTFTPNGKFGANDPVNFHSGIYRQVTDGFTISSIMSSAAGYAGNDPVVVLTINAMSAFRPGARAAATVTGNRLEATIGSYVLQCQREGV